MNLFHQFAVQADQRVGHPALIADDGTVLSYEALQRLSGQFAALLRVRGVTPGDRVVVQVEKSAAAVALYLGVMQCGAVFVPLNTAYTKAEVRYFLDDATPKLFVNEENWPGVQVDALAAEPDFAITPRADDDLAAILYTSGTTGRSKGAMLSHANLASNAAKLIELWRFTGDDVLLHILPIFHVHGLFVALHCALFSGASLLFETNFDVERVRALLPQSTVIMGVPTHYTRLLSDPKFGAKDCAAMRLFLCGSAPLLAETHTAFTARTGHHILER